VRGRLTITTGTDGQGEHSASRGPDELDGALGPDDRALVEAHLGECEGCAEHLRQIRITVAVTGRICEEDLAPAVREDLMDLYRRWQRGREP
jgi:anti-sigma factor RsiW